jgi:hypothetical protein
VLLGVLLGTSAWIASGRFVPIPHNSDRVEYLFLSASLRSLAIWILLGGAAVVLLRRANRRYTWPILLASLDPLALLALVPAFAPLGPPLVFVAIDLRWWRLGVALLCVAYKELDVARRLQPSRTAARTRQPRVGVLDVAIFGITVAFAVSTNALLRFSNHLHGDEPKYVRYCENLYQGNGFDLTDFKPATDLRGVPSRLLHNAAHVVDTIRLEARRIGRDAREFQRDPSAFEFNRARFSEGWFVFSKRGRLYQVHTPGVSLLLMPFYYVDRQFLSGDETTTDGQFAGRLWATNGFFLSMYALWAVVIFRFVRNAVGEDWSAWFIALVAVTTIPIAAFAFQLYPETTAGVFVVATVNFLAFRAGPARAGLRGIDRVSRRPALLGPAQQAVWFGALTGYLPWLHVRFLGVAAVLLLWALLSFRNDRRATVAFAAAWTAMVALLCFHAYHITGSFIPTSLYTTEGGPTALSVARIPWGLRGFVFDRSYGLLAYSPWYLLGLAGIVPFVRRQPLTAAFCAVMLIVLAIPSAAHSWTAAGGSPLRHLVALMPLLLLPLAEATRRFGSQLLFQVLFVALATLSIQSAVAYNRLHYKPIGAMVDESVSGWKINLLFPDVAEGRPLWPRISPDYLPSPSDAQARAWQQFTDRGCTLCVSSERGHLTSDALASLKPVPER